MTAIEVLSIKVSKVSKRSFFYDFTVEIKIIPM